MLSITLARSTTQRNLANRTMTTTTTADRLADARAALDAVGQGHLLAQAEGLSDEQRERLLNEVECIDWPEVARLIESHVRQKPAFALSGDVAPAPFYPAKPADDAQAEKYDQARAAGEQLLRDGKVAAFVVAGGQGTRLGWDAPKGTFPASPIREAPLFQLFAEQLLKLHAKYGAVVPWYVMTSPINHAPTVAFFEEHDYFGLSPEDVMLFPQAMMPAIDMQSGKCLLAAPDALALSPNGHGGSLKALYASGAIADMKQRGVTQISYFQVDNPLIDIGDPLFLGLHRLDGAQMSSKSLPKRDAMEKVGNFALVDGKMSVIEYSNMPDELATQTDADGNLEFNAGSIAIHVIAVDFVASLNEGEHGFSLPWNRAEKKVSFFDGAETVDPASPNAVKLETFVFDALPMCERSIVLETVREDEFGPIKNAPGDGVQDSPDTAKQLQVDRAKRWLSHAGVRCDDGSWVEVKPTTAVCADDLEKLDLPARIEATSRVVI